MKQRYKFEGFDENNLIENKIRKEKNSILANTEQLNLMKKRKKIFSSKYLGSKTSIIIIKNEFFFSLISGFNLIFHFNKKKKRRERMKN